MLALASVSAILPWPRCQTLHPWEVIGTHEDTLVSSVGILALDYWIMLNKERSSLGELALRLLIKALLLFSSLISTFSSTELLILLIFGTNYFIPTQRLLLDYLRQLHYSLLFFPQFLLFQFPLFNFLASTPSTKYS